MFCPNCGNQVDDKAVVCVNCGQPLRDFNSGAKDSKSVGWWWLGFFVPLAGFLVWLLTSGTTPIKAKRAGIGAIVGVITGIVLYIAYIVLVIVLSVSFASSSLPAYYV